MSEPAGGLGVVELACSACPGAPEFAAELLPREVVDEEGKEALFWPEPPGTGGATLVGRRGSVGMVWLLRT